MGKMRWLLLLGALACSSGCLGHVHTVGDGPRGGEVRKHRTWYALWGFISVNGFDSRHVVGASDHYRVSTSVRAGDVFFNLLAFPFSFCCQTTTVEK